ncbi:MAG: TIGR04438 family Trp-rich protein [Bdellovibrionales bacterium]|nr:TIGR04438 family Trp-rich protein [Massilia sp.]
MPIILLFLALGLLKYFEVWKFTEMSWWWVIGLMVVAFIWFEWVEKIFGLDKKKAHNLDEQRRKARLKNTFDKKK